MAKYTDCIYCGADTGSREHTFPAALGGRRMNKGILCGPCNGKFSLLDSALSNQLNLLNGLIGVRPDRASEPAPARVPTPEGAVALDAVGRPSLAEPRTLRERPLADGRRQVTLHVSSERQYQQWRAEQKAKGLQVEQVERMEGQAFSPQVKFQWQFGGNDAFREIGRIALNFLAYKWPEIAREPGLKPFKLWVEGARTLTEGEPLHVWYAPPGSFPLPKCPFEFGHQILLSFNADTGAVLGRVSFCSTFDQLVYFGKLSSVPSDGVLFNIDPLADAPDDLHESSFQCSHIESFALVTTNPLNIDSHLSERTRTLFSRIEDRQWKLRTEGLLDALNSTRGLSDSDRRDRVAELLQPHLGHVLFLARHCAEKLTEQIRGKDCEELIFQLLATLTGYDSQSDDGLGDVGRTFLNLAFESLVDGIAAELATHPLTDNSLRLFMSGGPGARIVGTVLGEQIRDALGRM